jgi:hypothetical protein
MNLNSGSSVQFENNNCCSPQSFKIVIECCAGSVVRYVSVRISCSLSLDA